MTKRVQMQILSLEVMLMQEIILTTENIYNASHYGFGVQDGMVMLRFTPVLNNLDPKKPSFTSYHSISFTHQGMRLWYNFGIGEGMFQPFLGVQFQLEIKVIKDFF